MKGAPAKTIRVEVREGGDIVEIGSDDTEALWGTINEYDPFSYVSMEFHIPAPNYEATGRTTVELAFTVLGDDGTRVELTQCNWEALGDLEGDFAPEKIRGGYTFG